MKPVSTVVRAAGAGVVHPHRRGVQAPADRRSSARPRRRARREVRLRAAVGVVEVVVAFDRHDRRISPTGIVRRLMPAVVLGGELNRLADAGAQHDRLEVLHDAVAKLEADVGAVVQAEQVAQLACRSCRLRRSSLKRWVRWKFIAVHRQRQRRRQVDGDEVGLSRPELRVVVVRRRALSGGIRGGRGRLRGSRVGRLRVDGLGRRKRRTPEAEQER